MLPRRVANPLARPPHTRLYEATSSGPYVPSWDPAVALYGASEVGSWYEATPYPLVLTNYSEFTNGPFDFYLSGGKTGNTAVAFPAGTILGPDGSSQVGKVVADATNDSHYIQPNVDGTGLRPVGARDTVSIYVKAGGHDVFQLMSADFVVCEYKLSTQQSQLIGTPSNVISHGLVDAGGGWYRAWLTTEYLVARTPSLFGVYLVGNAFAGVSEPMFIGNGTDGVYAWGAQWNDGDLAPYVAVPGNQDELYDYTKTQLFQDRNGTLPASAAAHPIGLWLDRRHGLSRGAELAANGEFTTDSGWAKAGGTTWANGKYTLAYSAATGSITQQLTGVAAYEDLEVTVRIPRNRVSGALVSLRLGSTSGGQEYDSVSLPAYRCGTFRAILRGGAGGSPWVTVLNASTSVNDTVDIESVSVRKLPGNHLGQATSSRKPLLQLDGTRWYANFDGVDDNLARLMVDWGATGAMSIWAGIQLNSAPAAVGMLLEHSADANGTLGSFNLQTPTGSTGAFAVQRHGNAPIGTTTTQGHTAPVKRVFATSLDLAGTTAATEVPRLQLNGANATRTESGAADTGTGNWAVAPLHLCRRAGATLPAPVRVYTLLMRAVTTDQTTFDEATTYVNTKTGAY